MIDDTRLKTKFHPHWDDYFQEKKLEVLIPAYAPSSDVESPRASSIPSRPKNWRLSLAYAICLLVLVNCSATIFYGSPPDSLTKIKRNINRFLPHAQPPVPSSVALALERAAAREASLLIPGKPIPEGVMRSSLSNWKCSNDGNDWSQRARVTRQSLLEGKRLRRRSAKETSSAARICEADFGLELPYLRTVARIGYDPATLPSLEKLGDEPGVTLVTQVPLSRLHILEDQCILWTGRPLAATVYIPLYKGKPEGYQGLDAAVAEILRVAQRLEGSEDACQLAAEVVVEDICTSDAAEPTNALRNRALRLVVTENVFLSDGMHLVSSSLSQVLNSKWKAREILAAVKDTAGVVIPAFAFTNPWYGRVSRQLSFEYAKSIFRGGILKQVRSKQLEGPLGWGLERGKARYMEFNKWAHQDSTLNATTMLDGAAPLALMLTKRVPWFDERVRGSAWAQALHVRHSEVQANSTTWATLGGVWAVRVAPTAEEVGQQGGEEQARANKALFLRHKEAAVGGEYTPAVGVQELCYF